MIPTGKEVALDTETTGLFPYGEFGARAFAFSFCNMDGETDCIRWPVDPFTRMPKPNSKDIERMSMFCYDTRITKVFFNAKFDLRMLKFWGIETRGRIEDVFFMAKILRAGEFSHGLKQLAKKYLDYGDEDQKELQQSVLRARRQGKKLGWKLADEAAADYWMADEALLRKYAVQDAERTALLYKVLEPELDTAVAYRKFYERELDLLMVTMEMEDYGVRVRPEVVKKEIENNKNIMATSLAMIRNKSGNPDFNPNSLVQMGDFIYNNLKAPVKKLTATGKPAVDLDALKGISHPVVQALQDYKASEKAISAFFSKYASLSVPDNDGHTILHPNFNQIGPITGRYSCNNPNLQNVPNGTSVKATAPIQARTPFCPRMGKEWYCYDWDSQEAWIFAAGSGEQMMLSALLEGRDLHTETAQFIWGKEKVDEEFATVGKKKSMSRIRSKMLLYGIIYGMGINKTADLLGITPDEARHVLERYYTMFPNIKVFMKSTINKTIRDGYVTTAWGRRIQVEADWAYRAVNYFVQGSAADMIKDSMLHINEWFHHLGVDAHLLMTVHDEIIVEVAKKDATRKLIMGVKSLMESHGGHLPKIPGIPCGVARVRKSWNLQEKIDVKELV